MKPPRLRVEKWLPTAAVGVECVRERGSASAAAPHKFLHVRRARRLLRAGRAATGKGDDPRAGRFEVTPFEPAAGAAGNVRAIAN